MKKRTIYKHWEGNSKLGVASVTIDLIADKLEQKSILEEIHGNEKMIEWI